MKDLKYLLKREIADRSGKRWQETMQALAQFVEKPAKGLLFDRGMKRWWRLCGALVILATLGGILWQQGIVRPARPAKAINAMDEQIITYMRVLVSHWGEAQKSSPSQSTTHPRGVGEKPGGGSQ